MKSCKYLSTPLIFVHFSSDFSCISSFRTFHDSLLFCFPSSDDRYDVAIKDKVCLHPKIQAEGFWKRLASKSSTLPCSYWLHLLWQFFSIHFSICSSIKGRWMALTQTDELSTDVFYARATKRWKCKFWVRWIFVSKILELALKYVPTNYNNFKHCNWMSYTEQLNNYFAHIKTDENGQKKSAKCYDV